MLAWEMIYPIGALILAVALGVALWRNHRRNKAVDPITEAATREEYDHPERYDRTTHDQLEAEAERRQR